MEIALDNVRQAEGILDELNALKEIIEHRLNLSRVIGSEKRVTLTGNKIMRICLIAGLNLADKRSLEEVNSIQLSRSSIRIPSSFFTHNDLRSLYSALLKLRYRDFKIDWNDNPLVSRIIAAEMFRGKEYLLDENKLNDFLLTTTTYRKASGSVPALELIIGQYSDEMEASLNINGKAITNTQILIAGSTGSGKTNLLAVLINQFRRLSVETTYPVNFLLFDYKGEFSDPANIGWLNHFDVDRSCLLNPMEKPLPFTPFKDFTGKTINEINLYSTEMANALCVLDRANISANMSNRLSEAIVDAYKYTNCAPITFELILQIYQSKMVNSDKDDSVTSVLKQLIRANLFEKEDKVNLTDECFIIRMDKFPKDGPLAKAIVYFIVSKLNLIYEKLEKQAVSEDYVQIRHFTIIDEAHYMLDFDNRPLRNLIAVGRNKGLSIILATQNMESFKSKHFDFYANAQYPLIMKQQTISDPVIKDLFGVNGKELQEIRSEIAGLQKGELIIKDQNAFLLDIGKKYKKIKVSHLI
jgi:energy-coupling factor transporter ATP-binding protein EcfA2